MSDPSFWNEPIEWLRNAVDNALAFFTDEPIRRLESAASDVVTYLEEWLSSFTIGDWVLLGLAGAAVYWVVATLRALTSLGPIEVDVLEHDGVEPAAVGALTAALRERLAETGLSPPPAVPAGTPQVNLISAVEASNIPQAAWLAKLLQLLPSPPRPAAYKICGVLTGVEPSPRVSFPPPCGLSFWIRPSAASGADLLKTVNNCASHADAIDTAALEIYRHISADAVRAFPLWARWRNSKALRYYLEGCRLLKDEDFDGAEEKFDAANRNEAHNALGALQVANLREYGTAQPLSGAADAKSECERAKAQADVLGLYLEIAEEWSQLVAARYRASVVAARLATTLSNLPDDEARALLVHLGDAAGTGDPKARVKEVVGRLRGLAARESKAVLQLLRPWYALIHEHRLRSQFEPKGHERRKLGHTVSISKHCVRLRKLCGRRDPFARVEVRYRSFAVHTLHLSLGRQGIDWQARYNAASFDALLLMYLRRPDAAKRPWWDRSWSRWLEARRGRVCDRAVRTLRTAVREAGDELSRHWVVTDPDFDELKKRVPDWQRRFLGEETGATESWSVSSPAPPRGRSLPVPAQPWGSPGGRALRVGCIAAAVSLVIFLLKGAAPGAILLVVITWAIAFWRLGVILWEAQINAAGDLMPPRAAAGPGPADVVPGGA